MIDQRGGLNAEARDAPCASGPDRGTTALLRILGLDVSTALFELVGNLLQMLIRHGLGTAVCEQMSLQFLSAEHLHGASAFAFDVPAGQRNHRQDLGRRTRCLGQPFSKPSRLPLGLLDGP